MFISQSHRRKNGLPHAFTLFAQVLIEPSYLPSAISANGVEFELISISGMAPRPVATLAVVPWNEVCSQGFGCP
jgi:hypothetical protein